MVTEQPQLTSDGGFFVASVVAGGVLAHVSHQLLERGLSERLRRLTLARLGDRQKVPPASKLA